MSTFYVLPPRPYLGDWLLKWLRLLLPGLTWEGSAGSGLAEVILSTASAQPDVYVVCREELPTGENTTQALQDGFGAEPGDEVVEVRPGADLGEFQVRRFIVSR